MKPNHAFFALAFLAFAVPTRAAQIDCEPARCATQAAINAECSCAGAGNHGQFVSCVVHVVKRLSDSGAVPDECRGKVARCAARSTCGKPGFVTCQLTRPGTCDLATATCVGNPSVACTTDVACATTRCKTSSSAERCTAAGGVVGAATTCCATCAP
jgi:hypothetical protein